jgi:two-component system alkaline phosphatase synthesis response regulator PhoP
MDQKPRPWIVLIVDDDALIRRAVTIYLSNRGYEVIGAVNGSDCLVKLSPKMPDVILLDVMMPGMDGRETCRRIREFSQVPIILLTARAQESDRSQGIAAGANGYITKPVSLKEVEARVRALLPSSASNGANGASVSTSP